MRPIELSPTELEEVARRRNLDAVLSFSVSRDGQPLQWRQALRLTFFTMVVLGCAEHEAWALPAARVILPFPICAGRRPGPPRAISRLAGSPT